MKAKEFARVFVGSVAVYVIVAACSSSPETSAAHNVSGKPARNEGGSQSVEAVTAGAGQAADNGGIEGNAGSLNDGGSGATETTLTAAVAGTSSIIDPVPAAKADPISGTRLKAKYRFGADGSKEYLSGQWWDSERNEDCSFAKVNGTTLACLPAIRNGVISTYYSDSECSVILQLVSVAVDPCPTANGTYVWDVGAVSCNSIAKIFLIGPQFSGVVYSMTSTMGAPAVCTAMTFTGSSKFVYYTLGAEIPLNSFVAATIKVDS